MCRDLLASNPCDRAGLSPGDSGSAVLDFDNRVIGLGFAGSDSVSVINKMSNVMRKLKIQEVL